MKDLALRVLIFLILPVSASGASFTQLGDISGGPLDSAATGVSDDGSIVVGTGHYGANQPEAFRWTAATGVQGLGGLPGQLVLSEGFGISGDGQTIVADAYRNGYGMVAASWTASTGIVPISGLAPNDPPAEVWAISRNGSAMVGGLNDSQGFTGFRSSPSGGLQLTGDLPGGQYSGSARGVSGDGTVVVGRASSAAGGEATAWTAAGGLVSLGSLGGGFINSAYGASTDGSVIVGSAMSPDVGFGGEPFRWTTQSGMVPLRSALGEGCYGLARAVSGDGSIVVGECSPTGFYTENFEAFIWTAEGGNQRLVDLLVAQGAAGLEGWTLRSAAAISTDGQWVVGWGSNPNGQNEAFRAQLAPIPVLPTLWFFGSALGATGIMRRKTTS